MVASSSPPLSSARPSPDEGRDPLRRHSAQGRGGTGPGSLRAGGRRRGPCAPPVYGLFSQALTSDARGIRALRLSLLALGTTAVLQLAVVLVSSSVALLADTVHDFADAMTAVPLWVAFVIGSRAATRRYTFGYRRAEDLAGLFVLLMILLSAILAGWESLNRLLQPQPMMMSKARSDGCLTHPCPVL